MAKVQATSKVATIKEDKDKFRFISIALEDLINQVNGNLEPVKNLKFNTVSVTFSSADSDVLVSHNLGRVISGYIQCGQSAALIVYDGSPISSTSKVNLKASAAGTARILFY